MKHFIMSAAIGALLLLPVLLPACDTGGNGTVESCATVMIGTLEKDAEDGLSGPATGWLRASGDLSIIFAPEGEVDSDGEQLIVENLDVTLDQSGAIVDTSGQVRFQGGFDLDTCEGTGTWNAGSITGTWVLHPREAEY